MSAQVTVKGDVPQDPRERVNALAAAAEGLSRAIGGDPADAISTLLCAAAKIVMENTDLPQTEVEAALIDALGHSVTAAGHWFPRDGQADLSMTH